MRSPRRSLQETSIWVSGLTANLMVSESCPSEIRSLFTWVTSKKAILTAPEFVYSAQYTKLERTLKESSRKGTSLGMDDLHSLTVKPTQASSMTSMSRGLECILGPTEKITLVPSLLDSRRSSALNKLSQGSIRCVLSLRKLGRINQATGL